MPSPRNGSVARGREGNLERTLGVSVHMAVTVWLWRLWKWLSRLFTRKCEIQRHAEAKQALEMRTLRIGTVLLVYT